MKATTRIARIGDEASLASVWYEMATSDLPYEPTYGPIKGRGECIALMTERFRVAIGLKDHVVLVAEDDAAIVGYAAATIATLPTYRVETRKLSIYSVSVTERFRGQGIGSLLLDHMDQVAQGLNIRIVEVGTVHCKNRAVNFYQRHGFKTKDLVLIKRL